MSRSFQPFLASLLFCAFVAELANGQLVNSEWNTGNGSWNVATNWFPNDVPDNGGGFTYDVEIGNRPVAANAQVTFAPEDGVGDTVSTLVITSGADLFTNGSQLLVVGQTTVAGVGTTIRVDSRSTPGTIAFDTDNMDLNTGGGAVLQGGILNVDILLEINAGSVFQGFGTVNIGDGDAVVEQVMENSGLIQVAGTTVTPGTLTLETNGVDTIDLDGDSELGIVDVANVVADVELDTLTLVVDGPLTEAFGGIAGSQLQIGQRDTITFNQDFQISTGAAVTMDGGNNVATLNGAGDITSIAGATFTITNAATIANDMTFTGTGNTVTLAANATLTLGGTVVAPDASMFSFGQNSDFVISGATSITEAAGDFDWDGSSGLVTTTIQGTGNLALNVGQVDVGSNGFDGTINLNDDGDLSVLVTASEWQMSGTLNKNNAGTSMISGDRMVVTSGSTVNVNAGTLDVNAAATINGGGNFVVDAGATADMGTTVLATNSNVTVNGTMSLGIASQLGALSPIGGTGLFRLGSTSTVTASTTINTTSFDWDGIGAGTAHTINDGVVFTVNSTIWDPDDLTPGIDDNINLGGNGAQIVVNNIPSWTMARTLNANTPAVGTATIGGTARVIFSGATAILNVDGNTDVTVPITFGASSTTSIDAAMTLDLGTTAAYEGGTISGAGTFIPAATNTVTSDSTITIANFDFDGGSWTIEPGATLTVNVTDYDPGFITNSLDQVITLNNGDISVTTGDMEFVMDGVINMTSTVDGEITQWQGEPVDIGNDAGALDADLVVTGTRISRFGTHVDFNSDAQVSIAAGATLDINGVATFDTVNAANHAEITGAGTFSFQQNVNVFEDVTLNMVGGTVDLDGSDAFGDFVNIDAALTINAKTLESFGNVNMGLANTFDIDALTPGHTGILTVNLDDANAEWTLDKPGVMNLTNTNMLKTLLAGSDVNLDGTVNVTGSAGSAARVDIGGTVNLPMAGDRLTFQGGSHGDPNRLVGGMINGPGVIAGGSSRALIGFGSISAAIDFDGGGELKADDGMLTITGTIMDVGFIGTDDADAVLNIPAAWNSAVADFVDINGGELKGGTITINNPEGVTGHGLLSARVINNQRIRSQGGAVFVVNTAANENDWDGTGAGVLAANPGTTLELRDNATFTFAGTVTTSGGRVFTNGFALDFNPGSTIALTGGTYQSTSSTDIGGTVTVGSGAASTIQVTNNYFLTFEPGSATTLNSNLRLVNNNINIEAGATFSGTGAVVIPDGSHMVADNLAGIGVLLDMQGAFRPGNAEGIGRVELLDYQQADSAELFVELVGTSLNQFDRLVVDGDALLDGYLNIDIDGGFVPALGNTFNIITANAVIGAFDFADVSNMPDGLTFQINYLANAVQLQVVNTPYFSADFDDDGDVDKTDLDIWRGAYDLNQLGDADGDLDSDGADFLLWQQQFGSAPGAAASSAVPEPTTVLLLLLALLVPAQLRTRALPVIVCTLFLVMLPNASQAQVIDISLNLQYYVPADPAMGGAWTLVAKTSSVNGISSMNAILSNVNAAGIAYQSGIGAMLDGGNPFVNNNGSSVEVLYAQDLSSPASVVTDVGRGAGTPGNLAIDPLNDPNWNNAAVIATGTFGAMKPAFATNLDTPPNATAGNVLGTKTPPFFSADAATVSTIVRDSLSLLGDYNLDSIVDAADYVVWRDTLGNPVMPSTSADGNGNGMIDNADYDVWRARFGLTAGSGAAAVTGGLAGSSVPEPATLLLFYFAAVALAARRSR